MIIIGIVLLAAGLFMFTQSSGDARLPGGVMTIGATLLLVGIFR